MVVSIEVLIAGIAETVHTFLQVELLDSRFVRRYGRAFDANTVLLDRLGGIYRDLVICLISVWEPQVVVF